MANVLPLPPPASPPDNPPDDQEKFGAAIAEEVLALRKLIADAKAQPVAPPIVQVTAAPAEVVVNVAPSEMPAPVFSPVFNVETVAPNITVQPAGPVINLETDAVNLRVNTEDVVAALAAMTATIGVGNDFVRMLGAELKSQSAAILVLADALNEQSERQNATASETLDAIRTLARAMTAPRSLVFQDGKPVGVVTKR